ncbi:hypothetical protein BJF78_09340 [Pseudonocardia sp. CNS-139]|nr:hypothetical protein BJF78_09340 [Pseudonocardia sp. CNS-139]
MDDRVADQAAEVISGVVERVFRTVLEVRDEVLAAYRAALARGDRMCERDIVALRRPVLNRLGREPQAAVGMGVVVAPGLLADRDLQLEWWQYDTRPPDARRGEPSMLEVDLNPASVGFYDYAAAEWFVVPQRTGRRHVVGPYVDVHGTDRYLLTLTVPAVADGTFLGIAGADLPAASFETLVLRELGDLAADVVVVNPEDRVVLSTSSRWLTGSRAEFTPADTARTLAEPDWRVVTTGR